FVPTAPPTSPPSPLSLHDALPISEPVRRRPPLALEVQRGQWALHTDPLQDPRGHLRVLGEDLRRAPAQPRAEPRELARGDEGERSEEHTSELQSLAYLVCRLLLEK